MKKNTFKVLLIVSILLIIGVFSYKYANNIIKNPNIMIPKDEINVSKIEISGNSKLKLGEKTTLNVQITPSNATNQNVIWKSSDDNVATINENGVVEGKKIGNVTITAIVDGLSQSYKIQVLEIEVNSISVNQNKVELLENESIAIIPTIVPADATNKTLVWTSSDDKVAIVNSSGIITAIKEGSCIVTLKSNNDKKINISVLVKKSVIDVEKIELDKNNVSIYKGQIVNLNAKIIPNNATNKTLKWSSSNVNVATVNNGRITGINEGTTTITVSTSNGKEANVIVTIKSNLMKNPVSSGGDPFVTQKDGYYYYTKTTGKNTIVIYKSKRLDAIESNPKLVYTSSNSYAIWAPEIHYIEGKWYIYYTDATSSNHSSRRVYVLRSKTQDAQGEYEYLGKVRGMPDSHAIDGTIFKWNNEYYFTWSSYKSSSSTEQRIYIAHMSNPYTVDSNQVMISKANYSWEKHGNSINEGPQILIKNDTLHIVYSASGADTIYYCLGLLTYTGGDLLNASSWKKNEEPIFESANNVYGPGHASFTKSPDGTEDWIVYHATASEKDAKNWKRTIRIQKFTWNGTTPFFGKPLAIDQSFVIPSGTK